MRTIKIIFLLALSFGYIQNAQAQKIVEFSQYKIIEDQYGKKIIEIKPHTRINNSDPKYNKSSGVYGVLICYQLDGVKKAARQDMTRKLANDGVYTYTLNYTSSTTVSNISVEYFNLLDSPKSEWPEKDECL